MADPGWHLVAGGRPALERAIGFRPAPRARFARLTMRMGILGYIVLQLGIVGSSASRELGPLSQPTSTAIPC